MQSEVVRNVLIWDAERTEAQSGDIVISDGAICSIEAPGTASGTTIFDGAGHTVAIPGFVNAHTHVSMTLLRGVAEELPLMDWLTQKIFPIEDKLRAEHIRSGAELAMLEMIAGGTTCFADMYYFMDEVAEAVLSSGMRAALCRGLPGENEAKLQENIDLANRYNKRDGRIVVQLGPHAPYTVPRKALGRIVEKARDNDLGIHFHWLETKGELESFKNEFKIRPIDYLKETGLLDARELILAHTVWHPLDELKDIARPNVTAVHNPNSNMKLGSGLAPISDMLAAGVNVALGTDGASSNNRLDMWDEMRSTSLIHKGISLDPTAISARDTLAMATVNGARGIGFSNVGLIKKGYRADIALIDTRGPQYVGATETNVPEFIVYAGSSRDVIGTICDGKVLYDRGEFRTIDKEKTLRTAREHRAWIDGGQK